MKKIKYILPLLMIPLSVHASTIKPSKQVQMPFQNEVIFTDSNEGLIFNYQLIHGKEVSKIVCNLSNTYKSWLEFTDNGTLSESEVYGGNETIILSTIQQSQSVNESTNIYRVDESGSVKVMESRKGPGKASCHYEREELASH